MAKKKKSSEPNLFTFLNQIYTKVIKYSYDKKLASAYMLSMWLSHDKHLIQYVEKINHLQFKIPDKSIYDYYMAVVPKGRRYVKWIKKTTEEKQFMKDVLKVVEETDLSKREAKMLVTFKKELKIDDKNECKQPKRVVKKGHNKFFN